MYHENSIFNKQIIPHLKMVHNEKIKKISEIDKKIT